MAGKTFTASVKAWGDKALENAELVLKASAQELVSIAQTPEAQGGRMPVDTGFLRNSLVSGLNGAMNQGGGDSYGLTIAGMKLGDTAQFAWVAAYARRLEYGFTGQDSPGRNYSQGGRHFVGSAAAQWQRIVAENAAKVVK